MARKSSVLYILLLLASRLTAQDGIATSTADTLKKNPLDEVVVTATRTDKKIEELPIPITTISAREIQNPGIVRLNEILAEQTGLALVGDHGTGVQMQGFDAQYTMILIDGEPLIGRTSGTLELSRITMANIDRIEIVKGPSSSLYGSEAMAGVINIITKTPPKGVSAGIATRYGTNQSADISVDGAYRSEKLTVSGLVNRFSNQGYSLMPESGFQTVAPFAAYTASGKVGYQFSDKTAFNVSLRYYDNSQDDRYGIEDRVVSGSGLQRDFSIFPSLTHRFSDSHTSMLRLYRATYNTESSIRYEDTEELYDETYFDQGFTRGEFQHDYRMKPNLVFTGGIGYQQETVEATRYDEKKRFNSSYGYIQADWKPIDRLNIIAGGRYDMHNVYKSQFSPKVAASYKLHEKFTVLASASRGYKAPDFRQLYLNFSNAVAGYSVFGFEDLAENLQRMQDEGQIREILIDPATLSKLNAESSWAYNIGLRTQPIDKLILNINVFRNDVDNLISTASVAIKTNGQSVFSYFNRNAVFTHGAEIDGIYLLTNTLEVGAGIQYLEAKDVDEWNTVKEGRAYARDPETGQTVAVKRNEYGGLLNRSKYMANARVSYYDAHTGIRVSLRWNYRGRYGIRDIDGNGIINLDSEYIKGYSLVNGSLSKSLLDNRLRLQLTADNIFGFTNKAYISHLPGRLLYGGLSYRLNN
ncbi:MAG TPA: TonB-dependent receptor [Parapedobacter sp.]|uniref:TonB-dependent receptor plug domain-containing protein n=1 Tax=Parapedobacter sp. TaxID=1958893 RepID=UPI002B658517|nr:TonB-dependent receptor [Parapedobacter sp.]HWK58437.1 TonB-dependent receptor [Parapedobacter sp.]